MMMHPKWNKAHVSQMAERELRVMHEHTDHNGPYLNEFVFNLLRRECVAKVNAIREESFSVLDRMQTQEDLLELKKIATERMREAEERMRAEWKRHLDTRP
jgi:hypothetical protein